MTTEATFQFKQFELAQDQCTMKVNTDGVLLGAWAPIQSNGWVLDIGTGTGVIANMLAQRAPEAIVHAVEINEAAAKQAKKNTAATPWNNRVHIFCESIQNYARACTDQYDLIVCNPPFFSGGTFSESADRNEVRTTIKLPHGALLAAARSLLKPNGIFAVVLPYIEGLRFQEMAEKYNLYVNHITEVSPIEGKPVHRLMMLLQKESTETSKDALTIQASENANHYTEDYVRLTQDFYVFL